jgi:glycosyltransferase involved in cell wall biosynthesis
VVLSGVRGDTRRYRSFHPYEQLKLAGVNCQLTHITDRALEEKIAGAAGVIFHRTAFDPRVQRLFAMLTRQKSLVISDVDDLVFDPDAFQWIASPDFQDPIRAALYQEDMRRNRATLDASQAVMASTEYLAERVRALSRPTWVHRNAFSLEMLAVSDHANRNRKPRDRKVIIGYASGTPTHDRDFETAKPALQKILRRYSGTELWLVGPLDPGEGWGTLETQIKHFKLVPWRELPHIQALFDINIAPLKTNNPFAQSKSEIKYVEAGLVRVPTIASPTAAFSHAIHPGTTGFLAEDEQAWTETIARLIEQPELREAVAKHAYEDILERYHPVVRAAELVNTINTIYEHLHQHALLPAYNRQAPGAQSGVPESRSWLSPEMERSPTLTKMGLYTLRQRGLRTLLMQVWIYFRRLLAPIFPY